MKECSREKVLKGKKSQYDHPYPSRSSVGPGGQRDQEHGVVLHDQEEGYQSPINFRTGSSQVPQGLSAQARAQARAQTRAQAKTQARVQTRAQD